MPVPDKTLPNIGLHVSRTYLLRVWREADGAPWRALVREAGTQEERRFGSLQALVQYLEGKMGKPQNEPPTLSQGEGAYRDSVVRTENQEE